MEGISWDAIVDFGFISLFLVVSTFLRAKLPFLQKYLIPNGILAGILGIIIGQYVLHIFDPEQMGTYVYHLLTAAFIAMGLRGSRVKQSHGTITTTVINGQTYALQGLLGMAFTIIVIITILPDLFPAFGLQLVMGFANSPGVAYSLGRSWEQLGFIGGGQVGLTFGAAGFLWAYIVGIIMINWGIRHKKTAYVTDYEQIPRSIFTGVVGRSEQKKEAGKLTTASEAIETMSLQLALVGIVFLATYYTIDTITSLLMVLGETGESLAYLIAGFGYVFGAVIAIFVRKVINLISADHLVDEGLMTRIGGAFIDYMIAASIAAISITLILDYWVAIALLSAIGGIATLLWVYTLSYKMHRDYRFERMIATFGTMTGTIASGLALLRIVDPHFKAPVAEDLVYAGGLSLFVGLPILLCANIPVLGYPDRSVQSLVTAIGILIVYSIVLFAVWKIYNKFFRKSVDET